MPRVTCPNCGGPHAKWDCKAKAKTAGAIDPVSVFVEGVKDLMLPAPADPAMRPGPGRPRIHSDRKAYKAAKQREYRLRKKEAGK